MEILLKRFDKFELNNGDIIYSFNLTEYGVEEVNNGDVVFIDEKKYLIEKHEYMMKSFGMRGDNVLVKLKEV